MNDLANILAGLDEPCECSGCRALNNQHSVSKVVTNSIFHFGAAAVWEPKNALRNLKEFSIGTSANANVAEYQDKVGFGLHVRLFGFGGGFDIRLPFQNVLGSYGVDLSVPFASIQSEGMVRTPLALWRSFRESKAEARALAEERIARDARNQRRRDNRAAAKAATKGKRTKK